MPVLITAHVENQTEPLYDGMLAALSERMRQAEGFVMHCAHRDAEGQWRVIEVWRTKAQADAFFAQQVAPALPPGVRVKRGVIALYSLVTPLDPLPETAR
jgi:quinol monooxygenase YgiN